MVRDIVGGWRAKSIWELLDAAASGDAGEALLQLDRLLQSGSEPVALFGSFSWSLRRFATATRIYQRAERHGKRMSLGKALQQAGFRQWPEGALQLAERQLKQIGRVSRRATLPLAIGGRSGDERFSFHARTCPIYSGTAHFPARSCGISSGTSLAAIKSCFISLALPRPFAYDSAPFRIGGNNMQYLFVFLTVSSLAVAALSGCASSMTSSHEPTLDYVGDLSAGNSTSGDDTAFSEPQRDTASEQVATTSNNGRRHGSREPRQQGETIDRLVQRIEDLERTALTEPDSSVDHLVQPVESTSGSDVITRLPAPVEEPNYVGSTETAPAQTAAVPAVPSEDVPNQVAPASYSEGPVGYEIATAAHEVTKEMVSQLAKTEYPHTSQPPEIPLFKQRAAVPAPVVKPSDLAASESTKPVAPTTPDAPTMRADKVEKDVEQDTESLLADLITTVQRELEDETLSETERQHKEAYYRLLLVVANRREEALQPIDSLEPAQQEYWKHQLHSLLVHLQNDGTPVDSRRSALALRHLRTAGNHLRSLSSLDVRNAAFCTRVDSFGRYEEFENYRFQPDQEVLLYVEVDNFSAESLGEEYETELQGSYEIFDAHGHRVADYELPLDRQTCRNYRRDYFIAYRMYLPKKIAAGDYRLKLTIEDRKGQKFGQATIQFQIH